jgi:flagellar motor protein MotB
MATMSEFEALRRRSAGDGGVQSLALALFLVILAFFIMLVSISSFEKEKVSTALDSVQQKFRASGNTDKPTAETAEMPDARALKTAFLEKLGALLSSELQNARVNAAEAGDALYVAFPITQFFAPGSAALRGERTALFEGIAQAIADRPPGSRVTVEVFFDSESLASNDARLAVAQAGAIGADLVARGVAKDSVSVGLRPGALGVIEFVFRLEGVRETLFSGGEEAEAQP